MSRRAPVRQIKKNSVFSMRPLHLLFYIIELVNVSERGIVSKVRRKHNQVASPNNIYIQCTHIDVEHYNNNATLASPPFTSDPTITHPTQLVDC